MTRAQSDRHLIVTAIVIAGVGIGTRDGLALALAGPRWHDLEETARYGRDNRMYRRARGCFLETCDRVRTSALRLRFVRGIETDGKRDHFLAAFNARRAARFTERMAYARESLMLGLTIRSGSSYFGSREVFAGAGANVYPCGIVGADERARYLAYHVAIRESGFGFRFEVTDAVMPRLGNPMRSDLASRLRLLPWFFEADPYERSEAERCIVSGSRWSGGKS